MPFAMCGGRADCGEVYWKRLIDFWKVFVTILLCLTEIVRSRNLTDEAGSSNFHFRIPKLFVSFLKISHESG